MFGNGGNGQGIVSMTEREKSRREAPLRQVEAYWRGLCDADAVPLRSQIDPRGMEAALENAFLMERIAPTMAKIRVAGTHLNELMGMQVAGMPLSSLIAPADREKFGQGVAALFADPAMVRIELKGEGGFGKPEITASLLLLPLRSDFGDITRGLGVMISHGRIGRTPRRFKVTSVRVTPALEAGSVAPKPKADITADITPAREDSILSRRKIELTDETPSFTPNRQPHFGMREEPQPFRPRAITGGAESPTEPERGHLRLVVDNG